MVMMLMMMILNGQHDDVVKEQILMIFSDPDEVENIMIKATKA